MEDTALKKNDPVILYLPEGTALGWIIFIDPINRMCTVNVDDKYRTTKQLPGPRYHTYIPNVKKITTVVKDLGPIEIWGDNLSEVLQELFRVHLFPVVFSFNGVEMTAIPGDRVESLVNFYHSELKRKNPPMTLDEQIKEATAKLESLKAKERVIITLKSKIDALTNKKESLEKSICGVYSDHIADVVIKYTSMSGYRCETEYKINAKDLFQYLLANNNANLEATEKLLKEKENNETN